MKKILVLILAVAFFVQCAALKDMAQLSKPTVRFDQLRIASISLSRVKLEARIVVSNPNRIGVVVPGYQYSFEIEKQPFLDGKSDEMQRIEAMGIDTISVPLELPFASVFKTVKELKNKDSLHYTMQLNVLAELPVLGRIKIPVHKSGTVAIPKLPRPQLTRLRLNKIGFAGADLQAEILLKNENDFPLRLSGFRYGIQINGKKLIAGELREKLRMNHSESRKIIIPIHINFLEAGTSLVSIIKNGGSVNFSMESAINENGSTEEFSLPPLETMTKILK